MPGRKKWAEEHPVMKVYADSPTEIEQLKAEAARNGLTLTHYLKLIISNRDRIVGAIQRAGEAAGRGVKCYACSNTLPYAYLRQQLGVQRDRLLDEVMRLSAETPEEDEEGEGDEDNEGEPEAEPVGEAAAVV